MHLHINYTEKWDEITDAIKIAKDYLKDFDLTITSMYVDIDVDNEAFYDFNSTWMGLVKKEVKSIKASVIKAIGQVKKPDADWYGLIVSKNQALETLNLGGQANYSSGTLEVYAKKTTRKRYGMPENAYTLVHEILHLIEGKMGKKNALHTYLSKYPQNLDAFLEELKAEEPVVVVPSWPYKFFKPTERTGRYTSSKYGTCSQLKPELLKMLDAARGEAGVPFRISSGLRSLDYNKTVGGQPNSAHLRGYAADILCSDSNARHKMLVAFRKVGFNRIGIYKNFIHVDCDPTLPKDVTWFIS